MNVQLIRRGLCALLGLLAALGAAWAAPAPASAHTDLIDSTPSAGAGLDKPPTRMGLTFSEDVDPRYATLILTVADADPVSLKVSVNEATVTAAPPADAIGSGTWTLAYRVVSADGHPVTGALSFAVAPRVVAEPSPTRPAPTPGGSGSGTPSTPTPASFSTPGAPAAEAARSNWIKWPIVILVALTLVGAPVAAGFRGIGSAPAQYEPSEQTEPDGNEETEPSGDEQTEPGGDEQTEPGGEEPNGPEEEGEPGRPAGNGS